MGTAILVGDPPTGLDGAPMMNRRRLASLLACCLLVLPARGQEGDTERERAIAQVLAMNGTVQRDETKPGTPVVGVDLSNMLVSDAGLAHLKGLTTLKSLNLFATQITDAGLAHLKGLTTLKYLELSGTRVGDAGLAHLKGLTGLMSLNLENTQVTDAGVNEFQLVLPHVNMIR